MRKIITIGREFGSGGRELGRRLAEELGFDYYDHEIVDEIIKHTEYSEDYVQAIVENKPHALFPISIGQTFGTFLETTQMEMAGEIYRAQKEVIEKMADKSDCVIVGRCADDILKEKNPYRIFVYAPMEDRIRRCKERDNNPDITDRKMKKQIEGVDKNRADYYELYTAKRWGDRDTQDLLVNTGGKDMKKLAKEVAAIVREHFAE